MKNLLYKQTLLAVTIAALSSCSNIFNKNSNSEGTETLFLTGRYQNLNVVKLRVSGKAQLTGSIKNASVQLRTIPMTGSVAGKCDGSAGSLLASGKTTGGSDDKNDGGFYSLSMEKPSDTVLCLVVTPTQESTAYSPFQKKPIPWKPKAGQGSANSIRVTSVLVLSDANSSNSREFSTSGNANPLTNIATAKFASLMRKQMQANLRSRASNKGELNYAVLSSADMGAMVNGANEAVGEMFFKGSGKKIDPSKVNFGDPSAPGYDSSLAKQFNSVLGGIDSIINKLINGKGLNASESDDISTLFDSFLDIVSGDIAGDGILNGQGIVDEFGNTITIPTDFASFVNDPSGSLSAGMANYVTVIAATGGNDGSGIVWTPADVANPTYTGGGFTPSLPAPSALSYVGSPYVYTAGLSIPSLTPAVTGTVSDYSISPALPTGLTLNTITGVISGIPTTPVTNANYTITASNSTGSTTATITMTINISAPTSLTYGGTSFIYITGVAVTPLLPVVTGVVTSYSVLPALPAGLSLNSATGIISGSATATQGAILHTITATNAVGTTTASITITVNALTIGYTGSPYTFPIGGTIVTKNVTSNGAAVSYSISPPLPTGLILNTVTGSISGAPTLTSGSTAYTITANGTSGVTATANINITVPNNAPTASAVSISGTVSTGNTLTGSHTFNDADGHTQGSSVYAWYRCVNAGDAGVAIAGATSNTYTIQAADESYFIKYGVIPVDQYGLAGVEVKSTATAMVPCAGGCTIYTNTALSTFTSSGWSVCYQGTYDLVPTIASIQSTCTGPNLMVACRLTGNATLIVAASSPYADVFYETGSGATSVHRANGVDWYYTSSYSWGFVKAGDSINRGSCDTATSAFDSYRLCWHTSASSLSSGYRCGVNTNTSTNAYERIILQK